MLRYLLVLASILLAWEAAVYLANLPGFPSPSTIGATLIELRQKHIGHDISASLRRVMTGLSMAIFASIVLLALIVSIPRLESIFQVPIDLLGSIPPIAWTPIAIFWFGIGDSPAYFIVFLGCFFPLFLGFHAAFQSVPDQFLNSARVYGASSFMSFMEVRLPAMMPRIITAVKTALMVGWFNVIAAELIGVSSGLGYRIQLSRTLLHIDEVFALMFIIGILGWSLRLIINLFEYITVPWSRDDLKNQKFALILNRRFSRVLNLLKVTNDIQNNPTINSPSGNILKVQSLSFSYKSDIETDHKVLNNINFEVAKNTITAIIGKNGCGKSTLLNCIAGLENNYQGNILFQDKIVHDISPQRAVVFQNHSIFPWMNVNDNMDFTLRCNGKKNNYGDINHWLEKIDLANSANLYPYQLSGGMQQKLAVVRALAISPGLLLLDEPFASFDPVVRAEITRDIRQIVRETNTSAIIVTHSLDEAILVADQVLVLSKASGSISYVTDMRLSNEKRFIDPPIHQIEQVRNTLFKFLRES